MKYHKQLFRHDPENGVYGDCMRTSLACIMDLEPEDVPHFMDGDPDVAEFNLRIQTWLGEYDLRLFEFPMNADGPEGVIHWMASLVPGMPFLLAGTSRNSTDHQVVVDPVGKIHDPALDDSGIVRACSDGYYWVGLLVSASVHPWTPSDSTEDNRCTT